MPCPQTDHACRATPFVQRSAALWTWLALSVPAALAAAPLDAPPVAPNRQACHAVSARTCELAHNLGRGVNLGNMLDAPREGDWGLKAEPAYIALAARHFRTVRLPVRWSNHAAPTADATIDEAFARRVDSVLDALLAQGATVILNVHHYSQLSGGSLHPGERAVPPQVLEERLVNLWRQIGRRYQGRPGKLVFELLNEPHGRLDGEPWNRLAARSLAAVRESNPQRSVIIGPGEYNHPRALSKLRLPRDANLIVAVHSYDPFPFTHQGVTWLPMKLPPGQRCCDASQRKAVAHALELAAQWNRQHGVPVHLGEFGAYKAGDLDSRARYARTVREEAERRAIGWAYWELAADFGVWSRERNAWVEPLRGALLD